MKPAKIANALNDAYILHQTMFSILTRTENRFNAIVILSSEKSISVFETTVYNAKSALSGTLDACPQSSRDETVEPGMKPES